MSKLLSTPGDKEKVHIARKSTLDFFERRADKVDVLGPVRAVIYQDKHPDLAEHRDREEKKTIQPMLMLDGLQRLLDVGCGTGRWTKNLLGSIAHYHGMDFSSGLVAHARQAFSETESLRFTVASADEYSLESLDENAPFDRILCCGVMIYLNDDEVGKALQCMADASSPNARIVLREPMGIGQRLTIKEHYSDELEQNYNAIYRTQDELEQLMMTTLFANGFELIDSGDVFLDTALNNRSETRQRWMILERS